jgi:hypothetical protein
LRREPVEKVGFVEVNVRFEEAGADKAACGVLCLTLRREVGLDHNNAATVYPDIQLLVRRTVGEPCSSYDQIHGSRCPVVTRKA